MTLRRLLDLNLPEGQSAFLWGARKTGLEVDFVLGNGKIAIAVKLSSSPHLSDLKGLVAFCEDYQPQHALVVCLAPRKRIAATINQTPIEVLPWQEFLENLWNRHYD